MGGNTETAVDHRRRALHRGRGQRRRPGGGHRPRDGRREDGVRGRRQVPLERHHPARAELLPLKLRCRASPIREPAGARPLLGAPTPGLRAAGARSRAGRCRGWPRGVSAWRRGAARGALRRQGTSRKRGRARVVSLHDVTTEIVVALGAVDRLVGVRRRGAAAAPRWPRAVAACPRWTGPSRSWRCARRWCWARTWWPSARRSWWRSCAAAGSRSGWPARRALEDVFATVAAGRRAGSARPRRGGGALVGAAEGPRGGGRARRPAPGPPLPVFVYDCCDPAFTAAGTTVLTDVHRPRRRPQHLRRPGRRLDQGLLGGGGRPAPAAWSSIHDYDYEGQGDVAAKRAQLGAIRALAALPTRCCRSACPWAASAASTPSSAWRRAHRPGWPPDETGALPPDGRRAMAVRLRRRRCCARARGAGARGGWWAWRWGRPGCGWTCWRRCWRATRWWRRCGRRACCWRR